MQRQGKTQETAAGKTVEKVQGQNGFVSFFFIYLLFLGFFFFFAFVLFFPRGFSTFSTRPRVPYPYNILCRK